jgi:hypothetical protein
LALIYEDVSSDGEADLIVYDYTDLFVFIWLGDHYLEPFYILETPGLRDPAHITVSFQDWTGDKVPEIMFDYHFTGGGTGVWVYATSHRLIHCERQGCQEVWSNGSSETYDYNLGGLARYELDLRPVLDETGRPAIRAFQEGFSIYCCDLDSGVTSPQSLDVYTSTVSIYSWEGQIFKLTDQQIASRAYRITGQSVLKATNSAGVQATIWWKDNNFADNGNDYCQLLVNGEAVSSYFGCKRNFTTVEWRDITNDQQAEIVVITFSAAFPMDFDGNRLSEETCAHQRLLAYQWRDNQAIEIANVAGCVLRKDLYGVQIEDFDQDGQVEILAALTGELQNRAYKWNGKKFVLWSNIPE